MRKNNKGFTLIEMLAAVVILGILGTITTVGVTNYLNQSRQKAYKIMSQSIYQAAENSATQGKSNFPTNNGSYITINATELIANGYLDELKNPIKNKPNCTGYVIVIAGTTNSQGGNTKYTYKVTLNCEGVANKTITWPDEITNPYS